MADDDRDRRRSPSAGAPVAAILDDVTPPPTVIPPVPGRTPTPQRIEREVAEMRAAHNALTSAVWETRNLPRQLDKLDRTLERMDERLDGYAERVVRAEDAGNSAWDAVKELGPKLDSIQRNLGETSRLADGVEKLIERMDEGDRRLVAIEKAQDVAAVRFEEHDKRDREMSAELGLVRADVAELKQHRAGDQRELALTRRQKGGMAAIGTITGALAGFLSRLLGG